MSLEETRAELGPALSEGMSTAEPLTKSIAPVSGADSTPAVRRDPPRPGSVATLAGVDTPMDAEGGQAVLDSERQTAVGEDRARVAGVVAEFTPVLARLANEAQPLTDPGMCGNDAPQGMAPRLAGESLIVPVHCADRYRWWDDRGDAPAHLSLCEILSELGAPAVVHGNYCGRSSSSTPNAGATRCPCDANEKVGTHAPAADQEDAA